MDGENAGLVERWAVCPACVRILHLWVADVADVPRAVGLHERVGCAA
ncbi:hypothetical protein [Streptosporangium oxazolinicum]